MADINSHSTACLLGPSENHRRERESACQLHRTLTFNVKQATKRGGTGKGREKEVTSQGQVSDSLKMMSQKSFSRLTNFDCCPVQKISRLAVPFRFPSIPTLLFYAEGEGEHGKGEQRRSCRKRPQTQADIQTRWKGDSKCFVLQGNNKAGQRATTKHSSRARQLSEEK